jgi:hypothetical protein
LILICKGPIVRISPDEIDICDVNVVKEMSKAGTKFLKSAWYDKLAVGGAKNIFSVRDPKAHSLRRRLLSAHMTDASLQLMEPVVVGKVKLAIDRMQMEMKQRGAIDVFKWWYFTSTDIIGELTFGESFQLLERGEVSIALCANWESMGTNAGIENAICHGSGATTEARDDWNRISSSAPACAAAPSALFPGCAAVWEAHLGIRRAVSSVLQGVYHSGAIACQTNSIPAIAPMLCLTSTSPVKHGAILLGEVTIRPSA